MIKIAVEAINEVIATVTNDEDILDSQEVDGNAIMNVRNSIVRNADEAFVRLALEQVLKDNRPKDYARFSDRFEEELEPVFLDLYQKLWGALPDGLAPKIEYVRCWLPKPGEVSSYQRAEWFKLREDLYGPPPYDYDALRNVALNPA